MGAVCSALSQMNVMCQELSNVAPVSILLPVISRCVPCPLGVPGPLRRRGGKNNALAPITLLGVCYPCGRAVACAAAMAEGQLFPVLAAGARES